ncbi:MAG: Rpn family recombination-promoting nuclease/putative transposase [Ktedonobacteraceae bacterium]
MLHFEKKVIREILGLAKLWDRSMKRLFRAAPRDFAEWLLPGCHFIRIVSPELDGDESEAIYSDILFEVMLNGVQALLHVEFQRSSDSQMAERLWEYNLKGTRQYRCPVWSIVLYLKRDGEVAESPLTRDFPTGRVVHRFDFEVTKLWEILTIELAQKDLPGLLPLLPLTKGGARREIVEDVIAGLMPPGEEPKTELLTLAYGLASLAFGKRNKVDQIWLRRRFAMMYDMLRETPAFQDIIKEGLEEGLKEGREKGLKEGREKGQLEALRQTLMHVVTARFPKLVRLAKGQAAVIDDPDELDGLIVKISIAQNSREARSYLLNEQEDEGTN